MIEIKLYKSPWKSARLIVISLPFVLPSIYFIIQHETDVTMSWFCLCFFGLGIPLGIFNLFDKRPQIVINEMGIFNKAAYKDFINWNLIQDAYVKDVYKQRFICLILDDQALPLIKINKRASQFSKALGFQETNIALGQIKIDENKFVEFIKMMSKANTTDKRNLLQNWHE